jgi:hypothetical protein
MPPKQPAQRDVVDPRSLDLLESARFDQGLPPDYPTDIAYFTRATRHELARLEQPTARDARGRKQYRYHPSYRETRDRSKFRHMLEFSEVLPILRERVERDLRAEGHAEHGDAGGQIIFDADDHEGAVDNRGDVHAERGLHRRGADGLHGDRHRRGWAERGGDAGGLREMIAPHVATELRVLARLGAEQRHPQARQG